MTRHEVTCPECGATIRARMADARPSLPALVSGVEAAAILGVSRQRVHQLTTENSRFPAPIVVLASGKVWLRSEIEEFNRTWTRKPGRPAKV